MQASKALLLSNMLSEGESKNLFDSTPFSETTDSLKYLQYQVPNGTYTMSSPDFPYIQAISNVLFIAGKTSTGGTSSANGVAKNKSVTITVTNGYYTVAYRSSFSTNPNNPKDFQWQIEKGSTATPYVPYSSGMSKNLCPNKKYQRSNNAVYLGQDNGVDYPFKFVGGITYTLSYKKRGGGGYPTYLGPSGGTAPMIGTTNPISFTPAQTGNYRLALSDSSAISVNDVTDIQVEQGSEATPYVPYGSLSKDFLEVFLKTKLIGDC